MIEKIRAQVDISLADVNPPFVAGSFSPGFRALYVPIANRMAQIFESTRGETNVQVTQRSNHHLGWAPSEGK